MAYRFRNFMDLTAQLNELSMSLQGESQLICTNHVSNHNSVQNES